MPILELTAQKPVVPGFGVRWNFLRACCNSILGLVVVGVVIRVDLVSSVILIAEEFHLLDLRSLSRALVENVSHSLA